MSCQLPLIKPFSNKQLVLMIDASYKAAGYPDLIEDVPEQNTPQQGKPNLLSRMGLKHPIRPRSKTFF